MLIGCLKEARWEEVVVGACHDGGRPVQVGKHVAGGHVLQPKHWESERVDDRECHQRAIRHPYAAADAPAGCTSRFLAERGRGEGDPFAVPATTEADVHGVAVGE